MYDYTLLVFLPMILFLGVITTYEDLKRGKIRNKWIFLALVYAVIGHSLTYLWTLRSGGAPRLGFVIEIAIMVILSLVFGFILWLIGLWTAGDAKLFTAFAALVPLPVYSYGHVPYFSSSNILINTVVPFFIFFSFLLLTKTTLKQKWYYTKKALNPKLLAMLALFIFAFVWPVMIFFKVVGMQPNHFFTLFFLFALIVILEKLLRIRILYISMIIAVLRIIFDSTWYLPASILQLVIIFVTFVVLRFFILSIGYDLLTENVLVKDLRLGMVPAEKVFIEGDKYKKETLLYFSIFEALDEKRRKRSYLFEPTAEGLTREDLKFIRQEKAKIPFSSIKVYPTLAFAPYMFGGVILTIIFQGNLFVVITAFVKGLLGMG